MNLALKNIVTLTLAVFYTLIASCGHGLHSHGLHGHGLTCDSLCCQDNSCCQDRGCQGRGCQGSESCGECQSSSNDTPVSHVHEHFAELRKALNEIEPSSVASCQPQVEAVDTLFSLHDCAACQLLSQIEVGFTISESHAGAWLNVTHPPVCNELILTELRAHSFDARGPPSRC